VHLIEDFERAHSIIQNANSIVALTGAGISTEAGIPDFRSKGGVWENKELMEILSAEGFLRDPAAFYKASVKLLPNIHRAQPTSSHKLLAGLESEGKLDAVITQNIDGLHQAAGSTTVYEIHGNLRTGKCTNCGVPCLMEEYYEMIDRGELDVPLCLRCRAPIKPDVVLFGDLLPFETWERAVASVRKTDLLLVMGSSLVVTPSSTLPTIAVRSGADLLIVNRDPTDFDSLATLAIQCQLGDFAKAVAVRYPLSG